MAELECWNFQLELLFVEAVYKICSNCLNVIQLSNYVNILLLLYSYAVIGGGTAGRRVKKILGHVQNQRKVVIISPECQVKFTNHYLHHSSRKKCVWRQLVYVHCLMA